MSSDWDMRSQHIPIEDDNGVSALLSPPVLGVPEAERYVEEMREFSIEEVGSDKWMEQHERMEKLNLQAHHCALSNTDEFILEAILTFDKLTVIIQDLIVTEAWVDMVFPHLVDDVAGKNSMRVYFILYQQATCINLLEVLLYHKHVCESGGELLMELVDYCARKFMRLNGGYDFSSYDPITDGQYNPNNTDNCKEFLENLQKKTPVDDLMGYLSQIEFRLCISAVSVGRFICEHIDALPLSVVTRITDTHDFLVLIVPLIENPPWTRRVASKTGGMKWKKLIDHKWTDVLPIDLLKLTKLEGQPWLTIFSLLSKTLFRERYNINTFRKEQLLRARKYLNDVLLDQLPILADIQRYMDELAISDASNQGGASVGDNLFKFQQVAVYRERVLKGKDWKEIAKAQLTYIFTMTDATDPYLKRMADMYCDEAVEGVLEPSVENAELDAELD